MRFSVRSLLCPCLAATLASVSLQSWCPAADPPPPGVKSETLVEPVFHDFWNDFSADHPICCPWLELLPSEKAKQWGFVNRKGDLVVKRQFDHVDHFREGLAVVWKGKKAGFIDRSGKVAIPIEFDMANPFCEGVAGIVKKGKGAFIDRSGKVVLQLEEGIWPTSPFHDGCAGVGKLTPARKPGDRTYESFGLINKRGRYVIQPEYENVSAMSHGRAWLRKEDGCHCVNSEGKMLGEVPYEAASHFQEGLAAVVADEKWGFVGTDLKIVIPPQFDETYGFSEGLAPVALKGKWGFIDVRGTMVIEPRYDMVAPADLRGAYVRDGKAVVLRGGAWYEIDSSGRELAKLGNSAVKRPK